MTTTTKLTDVPTYTSIITRPEFTTLNREATSTWKLLDTVYIYLVGVATDSEEPRKALTEWVTRNNASIN